MAIALQRLFRIRSRPTTRLIEFLRSYGDGLNETCHPRPNRHGFLTTHELRVEPRFLRRQPRPKPNERRKRVNRDFDWSLIDEIDAQLYEEPIDDSVQVVRWRALLRRNTISVVIGAPGSGKTFVTRHEVASQANRSRRSLEAQLASWQNTPASLWVTARTLSTAGSDPQTRLGHECAWLSKVVCASIGLPSDLEGWLRGALESTASLVVVDALDEPVQPRGLECVLRVLGYLPAQVVVTCRTMAWPDRRSLVAKCALPVELAPLSWAEQRQLVMRILGDDSDGKTGMVRLLRHNPWMRHAFRTPLLLTYACLLRGERQLRNDATPAALYGRLVRKMLSGAWRGVPPAWTRRDGGSRERYLGQVSDIACELFRLAPSRNSFNIREWDRATVALGQTKASSDALRTELLDVGILVPAGIDGSDHDTWSFQHRTLLEFLAARGLASNVDWLEQAIGGFHEAAWTEALGFLAGLVDDATPLVRAVEELPKDDLFGSSLDLRTRLAACAAPSALSHNVLEHTARDIASFWRATLEPPRDGFRAFATQKLRLAGRGSRLSARLVRTLDALLVRGSTTLKQGVARALGTIGTHECRHVLEALLNDPAAEVQVRGSAAIALGKIGDPEAQPALTSALANREAHAWVRAAAARALGHYPPGARPVLAASLSDAHPWVRRAAAKALVSLYGPWPRPVLEAALDIHGEDVTFRAAALDALYLNAAPHALHHLGTALGWLRATVAEALASSGDFAGKGALEKLLESPNEDWRMRAAVARTLGIFADPESRLSLSRRLASKHDDWRIRTEAATALGSLGANAALPSLVERLVDEGENDSVRGAAAEALGALGDSAAMIPLLSQLASPSPPVRVAAARALGALGDPAVAPPLIALLRDASRWAREAAAASLGALGTSAARPALEARLMQPDEDWRVQAAVAKALGMLHDSTARDVLARALSNRNRSVRREAAEALWRLTRAR